jgi:hypothetical protein
MTTQKKKLSGCAIALIVVVGLVMLAVVVVGVASFVALRSPEGEALLKARAESSKRPGAQALRNEGCRDASVFPTRALEKSLGKQLTSPDDPATFEVTCDGAPADAKCDELAKKFVAAEPALDGAFHFTAYDDDMKPQCTGYYDAKGASLGKSVVR